MSSSTVWTADNQVAGEIRPDAEGYGAYVAGVLIEVRETRPEAAHAVLGAYHVLQWPPTTREEQRETVDSIWPLG